MKGKHKNLLTHIVASVQRERLRSKLDRLVDWEPLNSPDEGCTAIIGVCSRLPDVFIANIRCLNMFRWPKLKRVLAVVDCTEDSFTNKLMNQARETCPELNIQFLYYSRAQSEMADSINLPYVYSWLSWCIALKHTTTMHVLIHDYDALVLGPTLEHRYKDFAGSEAKVQGIAWYQANGVETEDSLATTFEAFMDATWLRASRPVSLFNKFRVVRGRSIDFDTMLDVQHRLLTKEQRTILPMSLDELVHPSQMICQYTWFRRSPAAKLPCFSIPMIPFFMYLSGRTEALPRATLALRQSDGSDVDLLNDGTRFNLSMLDVPQVDWSLKQIVQACLALLIPPNHEIYMYGEALYSIVGTPIGNIWQGDFTVKQRQWINGALGSKG